MESCFIGTDATGAVAQGNEIGVRILGGADGVRIGGNTIGAVTSSPETNSTACSSTGVGTTR